MNKKWKEWSLSIALCSTQLVAAPSGLKTLPNDVKIPMFKGSSLPVQLLPHDRDPNTVYVVPTEGIFVNQGVVKSPITDCGLVREELKISEINSHSRTRVAELIKAAQEEYVKSQDEHKKWVREFERLNGQLPAYEKAVAEAKAERQEVLKEMADLKNKDQTLTDLMVVESDKTKLSDMKAKQKAIEVQMRETKEQYVKASAELRKMQSDLSKLEVELGEVKGKKTGIERTLSVQTDELSKFQEQMARLQAASEQVLKTYSERLGGYTTITADFAPSEFITALKEANPNYQFQYVPSLTATVDSTIPGTIRSNSPLEKQTGALIRNAKWSDPRAVRDLPAPPKALIENGEKSKDPVALIQQRIAEREGSLVGTKYLSLDLSVLGYCALREPETLASQFEQGAADTFKLALYFTYPLNYAIMMTGRYNAYSSLYEMHKTTSSSSWFGLSKKKKQEMVRRIANSTTIDIKVDAPGANLSEQDTLALTHQMQEQLLYFVAEPHLDKTGGVPPQSAPEPGALGASTVGRRLMSIPNPWTFWGGLVLVSLGEMFGKATAESITEITNQSWVNINYDSGFTVPMAGEITIGDLTRAELKVQKDKR